MKGKGKGLYQRWEDVGSSWGAGAVPEEVRSMSSIKVVTEDEKDWKMVERSKNKPTTSSASTQQGNNASAQKGNNASMQQGKHASTHVG
jgi:hypothetical protein